MNLYLLNKFLLILILIFSIISFKYYLNNFSICLNTNFHKMFLYQEDEKMNLKNKKLIINICMALDNNIIYQTLVSMTSALENNNNEKNILAYNLLLSADFKKENIKVFESLKRNYPVIINYYVIPNIFGKLKTWRHGTHCHYSNSISLFGKSIIFRQ